MAANIELESQREAFTSFLRVVTPDLESGEQLTLQVGDSTIGLDSEVALAVLRVVAASPSPDEAGEELLTTGQVADLLGVSRPTVVALVDDGLLPATRLASHRRIKRADAREYLEQSQTRRSRAMDELVQLSQDLGLYDAS